MERTTWTDERLDDLSKRVDSGFRDLRTDMDRRFDSVDLRFNALDLRFTAVDRRFTAVDRRFESVEGKLDELNSTLHRAGFGIIVGLVGVIAATLLGGS